MQGVPLHDTGSTWYERAFYVVASSSFSLSVSFTLCHLLLEAKAILVTIVSLSLQHVLKGDF